MIDNWTAGNMPPPLTAALAVCSLPTGLRPAYTRILMYSIWHVSHQTTYTWVTVCTESLREFPTWEDLHFCLDVGES